MSTAPCSAKSVKNLRVFAASRPEASNTSRSKLLGAWTSMLTLAVGVVARREYRPRFSATASESLTFTAATSDATATPSRRAAQPAKASPKLPVGTTKLTGPGPSAAAAVR